MDIHQLIVSSYRTSFVLICDMLTDIKKILVELFCDINRLRAVARYK